MVDKASMGIKTTDNIHHSMGPFCFNVLPFGISSCSEKFQKNMSEILKGLDGVEGNIDDVLVHMDKTRLITIRGWKQYSCVWLKLA